MQPAPFWETTLPGPPPRSSQPVKRSVRVQLLKEQIAASAEKRRLLRQSHPPASFKHSAEPSLRDFPSLSQQLDALLHSPPISHNVPYSAKVSQDRLTLLRDYVDSERTKNMVTVRTADAARAVSRFDIVASASVPRLSIKPDVGRVGLKEGSAERKKEKEHEMDPLIDRLKSKVQNMTIALDTVLPRVMLNTIRGWKSTAPCGPSRQSILNNYLRKLVTRRWTETTGEPELSEERVADIVEDVKSCFHLRQSPFATARNSPASAERKTSPKTLSGVYGPRKLRNVRRKRIEVIKGIRPEIRKSVLNPLKTVKRMAI